MFQIFKSLARFFRGDPETIAAGKQAEKFVVSQGYTITNNSPMLRSKKEDRWVFAIVYIPPQPTKPFSYMLVAVSRDLSTAQFLTDREDRKEYGLQIQ